MSHYTYPRDSRRYEEPSGSNNSRDYTSYRYSKAGTADERKYSGKRGGGSAESLFDRRSGNPPPHTPSTSSFRKRESDYTQDTSCRSTKQVGNKAGITRSRSRSPSRRKVPFSSRSSTSVCHDDRGGSLSKEVLPYSSEPNKHLKSPERYSFNKVASSRESSARGGEPPARVLGTSTINRASSRTLIVRNLAYQSNSQTVRCHFEAHGRIEHFDDLIKRRGIAFITFYDMTSAERAYTRLQGFEISGSKIEIEFERPKDGEADEANKVETIPAVLQITLKYSISRQNIDDDELRRKFTQFGEVKSIRPVDNQTNSRYLEFYDSQKCMGALCMKDQRLQDGIMSVVYVENDNSTTQAASMPGSYSDRKTGQETHGIRQVQGIGQATATKDIFNAGINIPALNLDGDKPIFSKLNYDRDILNATTSDRLEEARKLQQMLASLSGDKSKSTPNILSTANSSPSPTLIDFPALSRVTQFINAAPGQVPTISPARSDAPNTITNSTPSPFPSHDAYVHTDAGSMVASTPATRKASSDSTSSLSIPELLQLIQKCNQSTSTSTIRRTG